VTLITHCAALPCSSRQEPTAIDDAGVKTGRERNSKCYGREHVAIHTCLKSGIIIIIANLPIVPYGSTKRRPSQDHVVDKKRLQVDATNSSIGQQGISIKGVSKSADVAVTSSDLAQAPTLAHPAVVGGKSSRLVIGNLAADVSETELHRLGKVVPGGVKVSRT
jgi:hypothetical protein